MSLTTEGFLKRLRSGKAVNCEYRRGDIIGGIGAWFHDGKFVLTWEECRDVDIEDDAAYLRDDVLNFATAEEVLAFVEKSGFPATEFHP